MYMSYDSEIYKKKKLIIGLDILPIETLLNIARYLNNATDLKALAKTNKIFGLYDSLFSRHKMPSTTIIKNLKLLISSDLHHCL